MDFNEWVQQHSVGNALLDSYHHIFFQAVDQIDQASNTGDITAAKDRLAFLLTYANMHFEGEERILAKSGYPDLEEHQAEHEAFRVRIQELQRMLDEDPSPSCATAIAEAARQWLKDHILQEDLKFAPFLKSSHPSHHQGQ